MIHSTQQTDLFSGRNFLPELCGEIHPGTAPFQALHCALCSTEQSTFRGRKNGETVPRKGEEEGWPAKGAKRKKGSVKTGQKKSRKLPAHLVPKIPHLVSNFFLGFSLQLTLVCLAKDCSPSSWAETESHRELGPGVQQSYNITSNETKKNVLEREREMPQGLILVK